MALIVDHGVRSASGLEAALAERWLLARGLEVRTLCLGSGCGRSAEALRRARLFALAEAARSAGALHLLLGQHALDQAETVLIRQLRRTGADGLAAMAPVRPSVQVRLLRPLLSVTPGALRAWLRHQGQPWIEDPSNTLVGLRARLRAGCADRDGTGAATQALCAVARAAAAARRQREAERDRALAEGVAVFPHGYAWIEGAVSSSWPEPTASRVLASLLRAIGGHDQPVRRERLSGLVAMLASGVGGTAAGCLVTPWRGGWLVCREPAAVAGPTTIGGCGRVLWDGRWEVRGSPGLQVSAVGAADAAWLRRTQPLAAGLPSLVVATLPALRQGATLVAVPSILYHPDMSRGSSGALFRPAQPLSDPAPVRVPDR